MPELGVTDEKGYVLLGPIGFSYTQASEAMLAIGDNLDDLLHGRKVLGRNVQRAIATLPQDSWIRRNLVKAVDMARQRNDHTARFCVYGLEG